jgi:DNA invertase Pin-like site-specific DNA recombinase
MTIFSVPRPRPFESQEFCKKTDAGDVLMVTRLDRLARSTRDLLNTLAAITDRKAGFRSLADAWADTTTSHGRLMLTVLGGLAEFERDLIRARTSEDRERARARGVKMGRPPKLTAHQQREALRRRNRGYETLADIARSYIQRQSGDDFTARAMIAGGGDPKRPSPCNQATTGPAICAAIVARTRGDSR